LAIAPATYGAVNELVIALGTWASLHTAAAGTTGVNEAAGGGYARQPITWTLSGNNALGNQVSIPCGAGRYVELGVFSTQTGYLLPAPSGLAGTASGTGGTFTAATYYWVVCAINWQGSTVASSEVSKTIAAGGSCALTWSAVTGASGYQLFRGTAPGAENVLVATTTATSCIDTGAAGIALSPPSTNTASTFVGSTAFSTGPLVVASGPVLATPSWT
jgi:hypothetical protein